MNQKKAAKKAVAGLTSATGLTRAQIANRIGASIDTVNSWSVGRNPISSEFKTLIIAETGADIQDDGTLICHWRFGMRSGFLGKPFTKEAFDFWQKIVRNLKNKEMRDCIARCTKALVLILKASVPEDGIGKNRLPVVWNSFREWATETTVRFGLEPRLKKTRPKNSPFWSL